MRLLEAIVDANHRALAGDDNAGRHPADFADELPLVALSCIDVRLNPLLPQVLGVPQEQFIWLRNAGNIITGPQSSTMRSLSLACAVKGGKEIALIGPKIPIHGLLVDVETGKLDWLVNGYQAAETMTTRWNEFVKSAGQTVDKLKSLTDFNIGEMKFPETKIGETVTTAENWLAQNVQKLEMKPA